MKLQNKTAVVTGGSRGIGKAIVKKLATEGANVAIIYVGSKDAAEKLKEEVIKTGVEAKTYRCDVSSFDESKEVLEKIIEDFNGIDILVNNAGIIKDGLVLSMNEEDFDSVISVNLKGTFNMIKNSYRYFMRKKEGRIINISSVVGIVGNAGQANYASSKAGVIGLTKSVAKELAARNVTCNAIAPGYIVTDMTDELNEKTKKQILDSIPMKKLGEGKDVANLVGFLASDEGAYITGEVIKVDGGMAI